MPVVSELLNDVLMVFMQGHANFGPFIQKFWQIIPTILITGLTNMYRKSPTLLSRILDIAQEVKVMLLIMYILLRFNPFVLFSLF